MDLERRQMLEEVFEAIGSGKRLATLEQVTQGVAPKDIHKNIDASRSGVQRFLSDFEDAGLIEPADGTYQVTPKGDAVIEMITTLDERFKEFERERLRSFAFESSLSSEEIADILDEVREEKDE